MSRPWKILVGALVGASLTACVTPQSYEGASDYRVGMADKGAATPLKDRFHPKFEPSSASANGAFTAHDPIAIYLKNAYVSWCPPHPYEQAVASIEQTVAKCRIAVVVNVGSRLEQVINRSSGTNPGRIVYYSGDVQPQQHINQSFGPVYSNPSWDGNELTMDVTVLEMRGEDNARLGALLDVLAKWGTAPGVSVGASQLLSALNGLGSAFVQSAKDAVIGYFRFTLVGRNTASRAHLPVMREGDLILVRARDETREPIDWSNYVYDAREGTLYERISRSTDSQELCKRPTRVSDERALELDSSYSKDGSYCYYPVHNRNYLVFTLAKQATGTDLTPAMTLAALQGALEKAESVTSIQDALAAASTATVRNARLARARIALQKIREPGVPAAVKSYESNTLAGIMQCGYLSSFSDGVPGKSVLQNYAKAECGGDKWSSATITPSEFEYLARQLAGCGQLGLGGREFIGNDENDADKVKAAKTALAAEIAKRCVPG